MSVPTVTAARIYLGQLQNTTGEENKLFFEKFPYTGLSQVTNFVCHLLIKHNLVNFHFQLDNKIMPKTIQDGINKLNHIRIKLRQRTVSLTLKYWFKVTDYSKPIRNVFTSQSDFLKLRISEKEGYL